MKTIDGLNAYDILEMKDCPIKLPFARSMTQATIDFNFLEDKIINWYIENKKKVVPKSRTITLKTKENEYSIY